MLWARRREVVLERSCASSRCRGAMPSAAGECGRLCPQDASTRGSWRGRCGRCLLGAAAAAALVKKQRTRSVAKRASHVSSVNRASVVVAPGSFSYVKATYVRGQRLSERLLRSAAGASRSCTLDAFLAPQARRLVSLLHPGRVCAAGSCRSCISDALAPQARLDPAFRTLCRRLVSFEFRAFLSTSFVSSDTAKLVRGAAAAEDAGVADGSGSLTPPSRAAPALPAAPMRRLGAPSL